MQESNFFHREELIKLLEAIKGKTLGEVDSKKVFDRAKTKPKITGIAGDVIEQSVMGYPPDREQRPDLNIDGEKVELKTTGMRQKKINKELVYVAKEPASITAVSIDKIGLEKFENSSFWHKIAHLLFIFYHYNSTKTVLASEYANFLICGYTFFSFEGEELDIIKKDWQMVHDFIVDIQNNYTEEEAKKEYPNLSTKLNKCLVYLDTAPKYPNSPRFRLRKRVITNIIQKEFYGDTLEKLKDKYSSYNEVNKKCAYLSYLYAGYSMLDLLEIFEVKPKTDKNKVKQYAEQVIVRMFGGKEKKISKIEMFVKFGYIVKSVTLSEKGARTEDTKLFGVDFEDLTEKNIYDEDIGNMREKVFEDSSLFHDFQDNKMICVIFKENPDEQGKVKLSDNTFQGFKILDLATDELINAAKQTWEEARETILSGNLKNIPTVDKNGNPRFTPKTKILMEAPNLPKAKNNIVFMRGTGGDATKKDIAICGVEMLYQNYWIKGTKIVELLDRIPFINLDEYNNNSKFKNEKNKIRLQILENRKKRNL